MELSAGAWANVIAFVALTGSAVGFWVNRRDIKTIRKAEAEVRWGLSVLDEGQGSALLTNLGSETAYDVSLTAEGALYTAFVVGDIPGRSARDLTVTTGYGMGPVMLVVSWSSTAAGADRQVWRHPFAPTYGTKG